MRDLQMLWADRNTPNSRPHSIPKTLSKRAPPHYKEPLSFSQVSHVIVDLAKSLQIDSAGAWADELSRYLRYYNSGPPYVKAPP